MPQDIIDTIARIERHVEGLDQDGLAKDELRRDAVERCLEGICEAAFRLEERAAIQSPDQPWTDIRGMGNRLRHPYDQINTNIIWTSCPMICQASRRTLLLCRSV